MAKAKEYSLVSYNTVFSGNDVPTPDNQVPAFSQESFWQPPGNRVAAYHTPTTQTMSPMLNFPSPVPDFNDLFDLPNLTSWDRNDEQVSVQHSPSTVTTDVSQMTPIDPVLLELDNHSALEIGETDGGHAERRCSSTGLPSPQLLHTKGEWLPLRSAQIAFNEQTYKKPTSNGGATYISPYVETNYNNNLQGYPSPPQSEQQNSLQPGSVSPQFAAHAKLDQYDEASVTKAAILDLAPALFGKRFNDENTCIYSVISSRRIPEDPMTAVLIAYLEEDYSRWVKVAESTSYCFRWEGAMGALLADMQGLMAIVLSQ